MVAFPYFLGFADETGEGAGQGFNLNIPLPKGTPYSIWRLGLCRAIEKIKGFNPDVLVVSLGVDTFEDDPISFFKLKSDDFIDMGKTIASLGISTLFVMEGGYAVQEIGTNTVNVLSGFKTQFD
jgi:acetoin utilization deacetylase AcuC-like enzyme